MASRYSRIHDRLQAVFNPVKLEIIDESARHAGHAARNDLDGGETHYRVTLVCAGFAGQSRLQRSRAVHEALDAEFKTGLHALSLTLSVPPPAAAS